ncbi:MAG: hypothetical protein JJ892_01365 [Balneola sp.]|nr:hypothetical protein [Balneola sp.]MBO6650392.1 hypothetical protein [Balneola sp.]MBO6710211.1 hypothetical protein [Balneola sp.]MBO6798896.1 hypothetical protein [Balneola sp.]MBO6870010.1 hypothetical protein [Balneola sp.]
MKNLFKISAVLLVFAGLTTTANAQENVEVTATVNAVITLAHTDVALGTIQQGITTLDANANDVATETNVGTGAAAGSLTITGTASATVTVTFGTATLTDAGGLNATTFTPSVYDGAAAITSGSTVITLNDGGSSNQAILNIGGTLADTGATGSFSTTNGGGSALTFTVSYN